MTARIWPHLAGQPTVGVTPNAVPYSAVGFDVRCIFLEIFGSTIYFSKIKGKNKKFRAHQPGPCT
jgi:hypothetical protein